MIKAIRENKEVAFRIHSMKRAWERFGFKPKDYDALRLKVLKNRTGTYNIHDGRKVIVVRHKNKNVRVVFDKETREIVTVTHAF
jgi:ABC-type bacteriocin/lantibiotic exporter with double-glycine peptidase domain